MFKVTRERRLDNLNDEYVDTLITELEAGKSKIPPHLHRYIDHFIEDLQFLKKKWLSYGSSPISTALKEAWGSIIINRFDFLLRDLPAPEDKQALFQAYGEEAQKANRIFADTYCNFLNIYYSQKTCTASFAQHEHVNKNNFIYKGCDLLDVADDLRASPTKVDEIPVRICRFQYKGNSIWMALNNRGLAAINLARLHPLRLLIDEPTTNESNRFSETNEALTLPVKGDKYIYDFFKNINNTNVQAPYHSITGMKNRVPIFTVAHFIKETWRLHENNLKQNGMRYSI